VIICINNSCVCFRTRLPDSLNSFPEAQIIEQVKFLCHLASSHVNSSRPFVVVRGVKTLFHNYIGREWKQQCTYAILINNLHFMI